MNLSSTVFIIYLLVLVVVCTRILYDTHSSTKTLAYLLLCIFIPVIGILFYLAFGINFWKKKVYSKKANANNKILQQLKEEIRAYEDAVADPKSIADGNAEMASMLLGDLESPLTRNNRVKLLINGEEKFPEMIQCLKEAKHHIHIEYYIFEQDNIGCAIIELLIAKAKEGVQVRFIYDDLEALLYGKK